MEVAWFAFSIRNRVTRSLRRSPSPSFGRGRSPDYPDGGPEWPALERAHGSVAGSCYLTMDPPFGYLIPVSMSTLNSTCIPPTAVTVCGNAAEHPVHGQLGLKPVTV